MAAPAPEPDGAIPPGGPASYDGAMVRSVQVLLACGLATGCSERATSGEPPTEPSPAPERAAARPGKARAEPGRRPNRVQDPQVRLGEFGYAGFSDEEGEDEGAGVLLHDEERAWPGYNLLTNLPLCEALLIDMHGEVVKRWHDPAAANWPRAILLPQGDLVVVGATKPETNARRGDGASHEAPAGQGCCYLARLGWEGDVVWKRDLTVHHDVSLTPDGHLVTLTEEVRQLGDDEEGRRIRDNSVLLLDLDGEVLDELSIYDALRADPALELRRYPDPAEDSRWELLAGDPVHANSVRSMSHPELAASSPLYGPGNVIVSCRSQDLIAVLDWSKRAAVWTWGRGVIERQHEACLMDNGNVLLLDNGEEERAFSRVIEVDPRTGEIVWEYRAPEPKDFFTVFQGTCQPLPNGNVLVGDTCSGEAFEVTRDKQLVWRFLNPRDEVRGGRATLRIARYAREYVDAILAGKPR